MYVSKAANVPEEEIDDWIVCRSTVAVRVSDSIPLEPSFRLRMWNPAKARVATSTKAMIILTNFFHLGRFLPVLFFLRKKERFGCKFSSSAVLNFTSSVSVIEQVPLQYKIIAVRIVCAGLIVVYHCDLVAHMHLAQCGECILHLFAFDGVLRSIHIDGHWDHRAGIVIDNARHFAAVAMVLVNPCLLYTSFLTCILLWEKSARLSPPRRGFVL